MGFGGQVAHGSWKKTFDFGGNPEWGWVMVRIELWLLLDGAPPYPRREDTCFPVTCLVSDSFATLAVLPDVCATQCAFLVIHCFN